MGEMRSQVTSPAVAGGPVSPDGPSVDSAPPDGREAVMSSGLRAFRHRNFRLFAGGQLISIIGTWMQQVAQAWLVLELGGDTFTIGALVAAQFLPVAIFGLFGGVVADNIPKRATLLFTQLVSMILAFVLCGLTVSGRVEIWQIFCLAVLLGLANALDMPTRQAFLVDLVDRSELRNAIALNAAMLHGARIIGPAIAGVTIGLVGVASAFFLNGLSFLVVIVSLLLIHVDETKAATADARPQGMSGVLTSLREGLGYVRRTPIVLFSVLMVGVVATFAMNFQILGPVLADQVLDVGPIGFGLLMAAVGVGALISALLIAFQSRPQPLVIAIGALTLGVASIVLALSRIFPLSLLAILAAGGGAVGMAVTANATIQAVVPDRLRGRVMAVFVTVHSASIPAGGLLIGGIAATWGVPLAFGIGGVVALSAGAFAYRRIPRLLADSADEAGADADPSALTHERSRPGRPAPAADPATPRDPAAAG